MTQEGGNGDYDFFWYSMQYADVSAQLAGLHRCRWDGRYEEAEACARKGLAVFENEIIKDMLTEPSNKWGYHVLGSCQSELAIALYFQERFKEAEPVYLDAIENLQQAGDIDYFTIWMCLQGRARICAMDEARSAQTHLMLT